MLVDVDVGEGSGHMNSVLSVVARGEGAGAEKIGTGLYVIKHFSFNLICATPILSEWPEVPGLDNSYGVCDSPDQFMAKFGAALAVEGRHFCVSFTEIRKADQSPDGGWRWHKWGPYVGEKEPTTEYLFDEPLIDVVFTYHVYEVAYVSKVSEPWVIVAAHMSKHGVAVFWRENGGGYTTNLDEAGRYTEAMAKNHDVFSERMEVAVPLTEATAKSFRCVSDDDAHAWHRRRFPANDRGGK